MHSSNFPVNFIKVTNKFIFFNFWKFPNKSLNLDQIGIIHIQLFIDPEILREHPGKLNWPPHVEESFLTGEGNPPGEKIYPSGKKATSTLLRATGLLMLQMCRVSF